MTCESTQFFPLVAKINMKNRFHRKDRCKRIVFESISHLTRKQTPTLTFLITVLIYYQTN